VVYGLKEDQKPLANVEIETYDDHRVAMCFSLVSIGPKAVPVTILDPKCTSKTFPDYFDQFDRLKQSMM
jgi:3-phosphoshikimate 1-carboxyvinyltransferase